MPIDRQRVKSLFLAASELASPSERAGFLDRECGNAADLRGRVEALLAADADPDPPTDPPLSSPSAADSFDNTTLDAEAGPRELPAADAALRRAVPAPEAAFAEKAGSVIGPYKLREQIGEGGFGTVWVVEQERPVRRRVALKIVKLGMDTKQVIARFEQERQALAMMDHPNIAKVFDAGATDNGRPYFVMELVRGIPITDYCDQNNLPTLERLRLFIVVCHAVQHAHQKGIIHRDLKPSNILVTLHDGVPVPKVIDFGIAKATEGRLIDATVYTQLQQFVGTPAYMSPEQAEMSGLDIDTRSDIYSLGVLLYELLTGSTPFDARELMSQGLDAMRRTIREREPARPSTRLATLQADELTTAARRRSSQIAKLLHQLRGDLDWIVMKCLEKDRTRRYDTATGLAADLKRHLDNEPVLARPPSAAYKFQKACRRNKLAFAAVAAVAVALILGVIGTSVGLVRAETQRRDAEEARMLAEHRFQSARQFVNAVFQEVEPNFSNLIGASNAREALARISLTFVESLGDPGQSDEAFQRDLVGLYLRLADALGEPYSENSLGDYEAALRYAKRSLALWTDLARKAPSDFERTRNIATLEQRTASILWELGRREEAKPLFKRVLDAREAELALDPNRARAVFNLTVAHWHFGATLTEEGRVREALDEHFLPYSKTLLERPLGPTDGLRTAHACYVAHGLVGDALLKLGRAEEALGHFEKSFEWVKIKLDMDPNNARAARDRSELFRFIGAAQLALGRIEQGTLSLESAVRNMEDLVARDPANGLAQLEYIDSLQAQAKGFATQAGLPRVSPAQQLALWRQASRVLGTCQERLDSPALQRGKLTLKPRISAIAAARRDAQLAIEKLEAENQQKAGSAESAYPS